MELRSPLPIQTIDDHARLEALRSIVFTEKDLRAGWIGAGIPKTHNPDFQPIATWASEHWYMYATFLPSMSAEPSNILDIGCGIGHATVTLASLFPSNHIVAVDSDRECIDFAKKYNSAPNIEYFAESIFTFTTTERFQYIFCLEIFEHLPGQLHDLFIQKCLSLLRPNGKLFFTTPNARDEADAEYGHIGMLNRQRIPLFVITFKPDIETESFLNNRELLSGNNAKICIKAPLSTFDEQPERKSHFRVIFRGRPESQHLPANWLFEYRRLSILLSLQKLLKAFSRAPRLAYYKMIDYIPEPARALYRHLFKRSSSAPKESDTIDLAPRSLEPATNWHEDFIVHFASILQPATYVELGLYHCELFNRIVPYANTLIGIDTEASAGTFMEKKSGKSEFFHGTTDAFAATLADYHLTIDLLFIDANHSKESVLADFKNFFPFVADQGVILFHDAFPKSAEFTQPGYCGDGYLAIAELAKENTDYEMVTIPRHPGIAICRKRKKQLPWI